MVANSNLKHDFGLKLQHLLRDFVEVGLFCFKELPHGCKFVKVLKAVKMII